MNCILTINVGSATLKFAIFQANKGLSKICSGTIDSHRQILSISDANDKIIKYKINKNEAHNLLQPKMLFKWIQRHYANVNIKGIGHRVVHGGQNFSCPVLITKSVLKKLKALIPLAPLHMPQAIAFIEKTLRDFSAIPRLACFDTSFHRTMPRMATFFAIPKKYIVQDGIIRYGFHGLSYEYIASVLPKYTQNTRADKVIIAHLGNGASMCAMYKRKSVATSMGFTALDGLMMGTRCGSIDPGILIYLIEEKGLSIKDIKTMLYENSGLLGISGITGDVKKLLNSKNPKAKEALDLFCYYAVREIGALVSVLEGIDALILTGGVGENAVFIRDRICKHLRWLGLELDHAENKRNSCMITSSKSKVQAYIIPSNEELVIAKHVLKFIK